MNLVEFNSRIYVDYSLTKKWYPNKNLMILVKPVTKLVDNLVQLKIWLQTVIEARKELFSSRLSKCYNDYYNFSWIIVVYHSCSCISAFWSFS